MQRILVDLILKANIKKSTFSNAESVFAVADQAQSVRTEIGNPRGAQSRCPFRQSDYEHGLIIKRWPSTRG